MDGFAFVRCACFEERKLINCPVPYDSLYIDGDGWLWSTAFDVPGGLDSDEYYNWIAKPCRHQKGVLFMTTLCSSSVCSEFQEVFARAGVRFHGHICDGYYLASDAARARNEAVATVQRLPEGERDMFEKSEALFEKEGSWDCGEWYEHIALTYIRKLADAAIETHHPILYHFA